MLAHYDFVNPDIMSYFSRRMEQAPRDANFALDYVKTHAKTPAEREAVCNALIFKTNVLWFSSTRCIMPMSMATCRRGRSFPKPVRGKAMAGSRSRNISVSEASRPLLPGMQG